MGIALISASERLANLILCAWKHWCTVRLWSIGNLDRACGSKPVRRVVVGKQHEEQGRMEKHGRCTCYSTGMTILKGEWRIQYVFTFLYDFASSLALKLAPHAKLSRFARPICTASFLSRHIDHQSGSKCHDSVMQVFSAFWIEPMW